MLTLAPVVCSIVAVSNVSFAPLAAHHGRLELPWMNGEPQVSADKSPGSAGELYGFGWSDKLYLYKSGDRGQTWSFVNPTGAEVLVLGLTDNPNTSFALQAAGRQDDDARAEADRHFTRLGHGRLVRLARRRRRRPPRRRKLRDPPPPASRRRPASGRRAAKPRSTIRPTNDRDHPRCSPQRWSRVTDR